MNNETELKRHVEELVEKDFKSYKITVNGIVELNDKIVLNVTVNNRDELTKSKTGNFEIKKRHLREMLHEIGGELTKLAALVYSYPF